MNRILLVEDDKSIIENLSAFLKDEGFMVESTSTQNEALEMVENSDFDLVLLDISLAQGNGFAVCSGIKSSIPRRLTAFFRISKVLLAAKTVPLMPTEMAQTAVRAAAAFPCIID